MSYHDYVASYLLQGHYNMPNSNTGEDIGSLLPGGESSGFLGNAVSLPGQYNFTRNFTINPHWYNASFIENAIVSIM